MNDELKELLKNAKSEEEARKILEEHRDELTDADLNAISGGSIFQMSDLCDETDKVISDC